jgi:hypothetical protein
MAAIASAASSVVAKKRRPALAGRWRAAPVSSATQARPLARYQSVRSLTHPGRVRT